MSKLIINRNIATEAVMQQDLFKRRATVHRLNLLVMPPRVPVNIFQLPRGSAVHYMSLDGISKGPRAGDWEIKAVGKKMPMQLILELKSFLGNPIKLSSNITTEHDAYLRSEKVFRKTRDVVADDPGEMSAVIYNYAYLPRLYRYTRTMFTEYYRWWNIFNTMIDTAIQAGGTRTHFFNLQLPQRLPSHAQMLRLVGRADMVKIRELHGPDSWAIFELWKWLNPALRDQSVFGRIPAEMLSRVTLLIEDAGRVTGLNLATIDNFIIKSPEESSNRVKPIEIQKRLLFSFFGMVAARPDAATTHDEEDYIDEVGDEGQEPGMLLDVIDGTTGKATALNTSGNSTALDSPVHDINVEDERSLETKEQEILATLDESIEAHDKIVQESLVTDEEGATIGDNINERAANSKIQSFESETRSVLEYLSDKIDIAADKGIMSAVDYRKFNRHLENAANLPSPYDSEVTANEYGQVAEDQTEITGVRQAPDSNTIIDKSVLGQVYKSLNDDYIEHFLKRDIVGAVQSIQRAGYIVSSHTVKKTEKIGGSFENHEIKIVPIEGVPSTVSIKSVVVGKDGRIKMGGNDYRYRWQRVDLPILKISPTRVALSSYYPSKVFVTRSERAAYNYNRWLQKQINIKIQDGGVLSEVHSGDVFNFEVSLPRAYTAVAQSWRDFKVGKISMFFNYSHLEKNFNKEAIEFLSRAKMTPFGKEGGVIYAMDDNNAVYKFHDGNYEPVGSFESILGIDEATKPMEYTICRILGKEVPVGIVLGYYYGLSALLKMLGVQARQVPAGTRANVGPDEWSLVFEDYTLVFNSDNKVANLILSGLNQASKVLRKYSVLHFDQPNVYFNVLEGLGLTGRYTREFDNLRDLFVDRITERVLKKMGEPLTYPELVKRATEMLVDEKHKRPGDPTGARYRGAERVAGAFYTQFVKSIREHKAKASRNTSKLDFNPYNVWKHVTTDSTLTMVRDINPIHNLKEITAMTYSGHGGRNARSMVRHTRGMDDNDLGTLSDATVDSTDVGFNANLSMAPRIANMEGMIMDPIGVESPVASVLSPATLAAPGINSDDAKRIAIASIQHTHTIACSGYRTSAIRTGFEKVIAHQVDDSHASIAKQDGVIKSKTKHGIVVAYADGTEQSYAIGRRFGLSAGMVIPHDMETAFAEGEAFKAGAVLVYNKGFFKPDPFNKSEVNWMNGTIGNVAFFESKKTHEDASSISADFAKKIQAEVSRIKNVMVRFDQVVHRLVQEGDTVKYDDPVCIIEEASSAAAGLFDEESLNTLKSVDADAPLAGVSGVVDRVEVYYNGHPDDMSESLQEITRRADNRLARRRKAAGETVVTGLEDEGFNVEGTPLTIDTVCIRIYFTRTVGAGVGDKIVFGHQLKSEVSEVVKESITTVSGEPVDAVYGAKSLFGRNVYSPFILGTTEKNLSLISVAMAKIFKGKKP